MNIYIHPSIINGEVDVPPSKSCMQRACAAALLSRGETTIINPGTSNDDLAALDIIQSLGAVIKEQTRQKIVIASQGVNPINKEINCAESGLSARMFTPVAALSVKPITINGHGSLLNRPMFFFDKIFAVLGVQITSNNGHLPFIIQGPLIPQDVSVDGSLSSQFITGLLMAYGARATNKTIKVFNLQSKPYTDLTLQIMERFGIKVQNDHYQDFVFNLHEEGYKATTYIVEGDWSSAAFLLAAGAIAGQVTVKGLDVFSVQADKAILQALMACNAVLSIEEKQVTVSQGRLQAFYFNATDCPDLFPPLVALASYCKGKTVIEGVSRLVHKESNRAASLQQVFGKMGITITIQDDLMIIEGGAEVKGATVHSHHDHRIVMACVVAALQAKDAICIEAAEAINKSYPDFFADLKLLGAQIEQF